MRLALYLLIAIAITPWVFASGSTEGGGSASAEQVFRNPNPTVTFVSRGSASSFDLELSRALPASDFQIDGYVYMYWPANNSFTPLPKVDVRAIRYDGKELTRKDGSFWETNGRGHFTMSIGPYMPVSLVFSFPYDLYYRSGLEKDALMPLMFYIGGVPGSTSSLSVVMTSVRFLAETTDGMRALLTGVRALSESFQSSPKELLSLLKPVIAVLNENSDTRNYAEKIRGMIPQ